MSRLILSLCSHAGKIRREEPGLMMRKFYHHRGRTSGVRA